MNNLPSLAYVLEVCFIALLAGAIGLIVALIIQGIEELRSRWNIREQWDREAEEEYNKALASMAREDELHRRLQKEQDENYYE